jgi:hypothetical protein
MTIIKDSLLEPFYIGKDAYCYTVYEVITPNADNLEAGSKGKDYEKPVGHYSHFGKALEKVAKSKLNLKEEYSSIQEYIETYNQLKQDINQLIEIDL